MKARRMRRGARRGGERRGEVVLTVQGQGSGRWRSHSADELEPRVSRSPGSDLWIGALSNPVRVRCMLLLQVFYVLFFKVDRTYSRALGRGVKCGEAEGDPKRTKTRCMPSRRGARRARP